MKKHERQPEPRLSLRGVHKYLNVFEAPQVANRRLLSAMVMMGAGCLAMGLGMFRMLPLKERVPYVVKVEADATGQPTGNVTVQADAGVMQFKPTEAHVRFFLGRWAEDLLSVDATSKDTRLPQSFALLKGQGLEDWKRYVNEDAKPLEVLVKDPTYRQRAELISITFLTQDTAMIRVKLTNNKGLERRVQVNVTYALIPPQSDKDVYRNPIGLWITTFGVTNELA